MKNRFTRTFWKIIVFVAGATFGFNPTAYAGIVAQYPFNVDKNPSSIATNVQSSTYNGSNLYNSYIGDDGYGNILEAYPSTGAIDASSALSNNSYFTVALTANAGQTIDIGTVEFEVGKGGSSDPRGYFIRSSVDGYTADLIAETLPLGSQPPPAQKTINVSGNPAYQGLNSITFRFYVFTPAQSGWYSVDFRNLTFLTPTVSADLDAGLALIMGLGVLGAAAIAFRQRQI
ncbi:MAG: hypothetical protein ACU837_14780 [Gammaproteobacteria bacterium]